MEWRDIGYVLGSKRHGETSVLLEVMTKTRGRHMGLVRGGRSRRMQPTLQPGNLLELTWRARLETHLGTFQVEPLELNASRFLESAAAIYGIQTLAAHLRLLPERDPHNGLFEALGLIAQYLDNPVISAVLLARFEIALLDELGFGLDLNRCALTGQTNGLAYVSPKTGRAVTRQAGAPWADKLLPLPAILLGESAEPHNIDDILQCFTLSGHFLEMHIYGARGTTVPEARAGFISAIIRAFSLERHEAV